MKTNWLVRLLFLFFLAVSCTTEEEEECDYSSCMTIPPTTGKLTIKVTRNEQNPYVPISIYLGKFENGILLLRDTLNENIKTFDVPIDQFITASAYYNMDNQKVIVMNSGKVKLKKEKTCDSICYWVIDLTLSLKLKK